MNDKITSPVPVKKDSKAMTFPEAMQAIIGGSRVTRQEWGSNAEYGFIKDEKLSIHTKGKDHSWIVSSGDMMNSDWIVLPTVN